MKRRKGWRLGCVVGEATEGLENEALQSHFTYVTAHSPTLLSLHLRHSSFSNPSSASLTSQLILKLLSLHLHHSSFSKLPSLHLRHSLFSKPSSASFTSQLILKLFVASPTSQLIFQPFRRFTYVTAHCSTLTSLYLRHGHFTYVTWRAAHGLKLGKRENPENILKKFQHCQPLLTPLRKRDSNCGPQFKSD